MCFLDGYGAVLGQYPNIRITKNTNIGIMRGKLGHAARVGSLFFTISGSDLQAWSIVERCELNLICGYPNYQLASMMAQAS